MSRIQTSVLSLVFLFFLLCFFVNPMRYLSAFSDGISLWAVSVLPSLFPFLFSMSMLNDLGLLHKIGEKLSPLFRFLFGISGTGGCIFVLSLLSGYPVGAKLVSECVRSGKITLSEGEKLAPICSSCSPLFLLGAIGRMYSVKVAYFLFLINVLTIFLTGLIFRFRKCEIKSLPLDQSKKGLSETMISSILSVLCVGAYVALFSALICMIGDVIPGEIYKGFLEMTIGCKSVKGHPLSLPLCALFITSGGACILLQQITFLSEAKIKVLPYLLVKVLEGIIAFFLALIGTNYL